jgi:hypothetical protein
MSCLTTAIIQNGVFWDVTPCGVCKNRVSEELSAYFIRVTGIGELETTQALTSNQRTLRRNTRATRRYIPEDAILHSRRRETLKSYISLTGWTL